jgi:tetratricopeptide (TPR) repeat protein
MRKARDPVGLFCILLLTVGFNTQLHSQNPPDARALVGIGRSSLEENDPYAAVDAFRSALRINPAYAEARLGMAESLFLLGEYKEAGREVDKARALSSGNREMTLLEARILTALRDYDSAVSIYQGLLQGRPHDAEANRGLAEIYAILGQRELAGEAYDRTLRYSPGDRRVLLQLVILHDAARERTQAEAALTKALQRYPENLFVRLQAAEHFALYGDWRQSMEHLDRAKSMVDSDDPKFRRIGLLDAELSLRRGDPAAAIAVLSTLPDQNTTEVLYLMARAHRELGDEDLSQTRAKALLTLDSEDEIARMYREEALFRTAEGYAADRRDASSWHLERGRRFEEEFYYRRAYDEYRRALLIAKTDPDVWIAFADLIRKMGFPEYYRDTSNVALMNIPPERSESATLKRRLNLLEHSQEETLAQRWGIDEPWIVPAAAWTLGVFFTDESSSLPIHGESGRYSEPWYFADIVDSGGNIEVPSVSGINDLMCVESQASLKPSGIPGNSLWIIFLMMGLSKQNELSMRLPNCFWRGPESLWVDWTS